MDRRSRACRTCPCIKELEEANRLLTTATFETEALVFVFEVMNMLEGYGFHVSDRRDALGCIKALCEVTNSAEIQQSMEVPQYES